MADKGKNDSTGPNRKPDPSPADLERWAKDKGQEVNDRQTPPDGGDNSK